MAGTSIFCATSQASADPNPNNHGLAPQWVQLGGPAHVGVYIAPDAGSSKYDNITLSPGNSVYVDCWVAGGNVGNAGDVWYRTTAVDDGEPQPVYVGDSWTFAPYVDGAGLFHAVPGLPAC
ncbi:hypothetical protein [Streptantibioticus cattleyicolor]|nr:hypothetical protein [Streptantibioticus cattleyicolor]